MKEHIKHTALTKSLPGFFGRIEVSILGTPCGNIKELSNQIIQGISPNFKVSYVDADHKSTDQEASGAPSSLSHGATMEYTDKISFQRFDVNSRINEYDIKGYFLDADLVLVNGNHFQANHQIVVIDPEKPLQKKLDRLTHVLAFILKGSPEIPAYIKEHIAGWNTLPVFSWGENEKISLFVKDHVANNAPNLKGLVLAGGKSSRMKQDKSLIDYHGTTQIEHSHRLLQPFCEEVFVSCPADHRSKVPSAIPIIEDSFMELGPFGALLSAFKKFPNTAWLVIACDLPLLNAATLEFLVANRNTSKIATAYLGQDQEFPEPLITIWEPKSYFRLLYFLGLGYSCPRKVLINSDYQLLQAPDVQLLQNVNFPDEYEAVKNILKNQH